MTRRLFTLIIIVPLLSNWMVSIGHAAELNIEKAFTEADGLASNTVLTVFEDSRGNIWFGTTDGLTHYDGENFRTFTTEDGLARNTIGLIFEDRQGMLWFADGVLSSFLERGKSMDMSWMETPLSELDLDIQPYHETTEETRSVVPLKGVSRYDGQAFKILTTADGLARDTVTDIFEDEAGTLWFATRSGVGQYDGEKFNNIIINGPMGMNVLSDWWNQITAIAQDTVGNFWFGSTAGITYYNVQKSHFRYFAVDSDFAPFQEMGQSPNTSITDLHFDTKENLWMSRDGMDKEDSGIRRYDGKKLTIFPQSEALPMNSVDNIMQDSSGNLWFTGVKNLPSTLNETEEGVSMVYNVVNPGVSVYNGERFQHFNKDDGLPSNRVWSVFEDSKGKLWFATNAGVAVGVYLPSQNSDN